MNNNQHFWRQKIENYEPTFFYRQTSNSPAFSSESSKANRFPVKLTLPFLCKGAKDVEHLQTWFVLFLGRINCTDSVNIGLIENCQKEHGSIVPAIFFVDCNMSVFSVFERCLDELKSHKENGTVLHDIYYCNRDLRVPTRTIRHNMVIGSNIKDHKYIKEIILDCNVLLLFESNCSEIEVLYNEHSALYNKGITAVLYSFATFLQSINKCKDDTKLRLISLVSIDDLKRFYKQPSIKIGTFINEKLAELINNQCTVTPLRTAIRTTKHIMTYRKLSEEITKFANILKCCISNDTDPKSVVAVHLPNSTAYVVSLLTLVRSGVIFLPLPIELPVNRIAFMLKDANAQHIIMTKETFDNCHQYVFNNHVCKTMIYDVADELLVVVEIDEFTKQPAQSYHCDNVLSSYAKPTVREVIDKDIAYIVYTSGSTGRPKGVMVKESSVINLARSQITCWNIRPGEVIAQFACIGFDASISEIFTSLLSGAELAILDLSERHGKGFVHAMNQMKVSMITLAPSALRIYSPTELPHLKKVITAGEICTLDIVLKWTSAEQIRFFNAYGPTETTVCATCYEHIPGSKYEYVNRELPIGKAIGGVNVYLFDDLVSPVPQGVIGEIYIGGTGMSHGYIGHATHFNKDKFVKFPLNESNAIVYKSGDYAFRDKDGNITFAGRKDDQVKIRGHRINLSEIEHVCIQHPKVDTAVIIDHKCEKTEELSICAYITPTCVDVSELRQYLSKAFPRYMIPAYIKTLEVTDIPTTLNGKVNRKQLERNEDIHMQADTGSKCQLQGIDLQVANMWCHVFKLEDSFADSLHMQSSFSDLGGNSLHLVQLLRLIEDILKVDVSFTDLGTADTVQEFSEVIRRRRDISFNCTNIKSQELKEMIFHDSTLDTGLFTNHERRRSVQFKSLPAVTRACHSKRHPKKVLISGVTGFLGAFLLSELLEQTDTHVYCMVRESTEVRGMGRIIDNMRKYGLWKFEYSSRVAVVISDLSQKNIGIAPDIYKSLCNAIDVVFMNAAMMNFNTTYEDHKVANVLGTKEFIKFASTGVQKYLFTTSSLSVFLFPPEPVKNGSDRRICSESEFFDDPLCIEGGYGQSKWASERLVMQALDFLPGGAIFRPARVSGRSTDGLGPKDDLFARTLIGMKKLGAYPDVDFPYDLIPVDFCAKSMIQIALKHYCSEQGVYERVYHLFNNDTIPFKELFDGMDLKSLPLQDWRDLLKEADGTHKELLPLVPFFLSKFLDMAPNWPIFKTTNTDKETPGAVKEIMKPTRELLKIYKVYFGI